MKMGYNPTKRKESLRKKEEMKQERRKQMIDADGSWIPPVTARLVAAQLAAVAALINDCRRAPIECYGRTTECCGRTIVALPHYLALLPPCPLSPPRH